MKPYNLRHELMKLPPPNWYNAYLKRKGSLAMGYVLTVAGGCLVLELYVLVSIITG